ncbi:MAG: hypothetical protein AB1758_03235 [Candidatus Eremiobacterota bacterium]
MDSFRRIEALVERLESQGPTPLVESARELVGRVLDLHREGLAVLLRQLDPERLRELARDPLVGHLLMLHDLHPDSAEERVRRALAPFPGVSLLECAPARVRLRLSDPEVRERVCAALLAEAPDAGQVHCEDASGQPLLRVLG